MPVIRSRPAALAAGGIALTAALVVAAPLAASAHVHVVPVQARAGAAAVDLVFEVPNERPSASTTSLAVALPAGLTTLDPAAVRGWTVATAADRRTVRFTATGDGIGADQTQTFAVRIGPVPAVGRLPLPVTQTYSDGAVVRWDDPVPASGAEPEHPAPVLYVQDRAPAEHDEATEAADASATSGDVAVPTVLAIAALVVGVLAVLLALLALLRTRRAR